MKELSKKKYVTLITIMILVLGIIGIVNIGNIDLDKGKVKLKSASIEKLKSSVIESKGYEEITYPVLYELEKVEGIEERNVIIKGTLTKEENKYARFKEITSKTITSTVSENGREIEIRIEKVKLGRQNKINIKIEINGAINETKIKPEIEIKEESEKEYTKVNTEEIEVKTNSVTGLVQDEEGMSVSNLELSINKGNEEIRRTYTDENGRYVFSDVEEGKYIIKIEEENYELKEIKEVEVIGGITENIIVKKIKPYEIEVKKYISKIKLNNNGKEIEYEYGKLNKVNQTVKNLKNLSGEIEYKIEIKNTGEKSGEITKIEEELTEGLKFNKEKNSEWEEKNGKIINRSLEGIKLKAGEEKEITLKLDIEKTDEARSYLQKVTAKGEVYQNVVYILGGKEYRKEKVLEGEKIEEPKIVQENFKGWYTDKKYTNKYNFENSVTKDIILYGKVEESTKKYIVQYIDEGKIIKEEELEEGSIINVPEVTKEGYTFDGWYEGEEKYDVYEPITRNLILESKYEINKYKVRFINEDGSVLQEETLDYGSTPTYKKETPTKKRTEEYTYEFDKWSPEITKVTGNQEYKATYKETKNKYTVTYINEGTEYHKETAEYGSVVTSIQDPTKEGYTFTGWYTKDNEKVSYPITVTENITLYSKYEINSYKVSYYNEGKKYIEDQKINYGENALKPNTDPSKIGYTFKYWSLKENGEEYEFSTKITKDINLYAVYEINKYTVTYINEGIEYHKETAEYGSVVTSIQDPTKEGYTFTGWYTKDNEKVSYPITVTENITLYSKYEINSYKVSYYNEGKKYIDDQQINYGENALKPNTNPSKIGYTFKYWSIKENGEEYEFSTKITKDINLYAVYEINKYTVTYINEGTEYHKETAEYGSVVTSIQDPTKEGYTFIGWYNENNEKINHPITVTENITLHSKYEINTYTVSFYHNNEKYVEDQKINYGESAVKPSIDPTKEDYNFSGWVIKGTNNKYDFTSKVTKDIELESSFTAKPTYTVTFKIENEEILTENVIEGHKVTSKEAPYKKGYLFDKWYSDEGLTIENNFDEKIMNNKIIYGKYNENKHTVTYMNEKEVYYTEEVLDRFTAKGPSENPSKEGYTFKYFSKDKKVAFDYSAEITEDTTLYAVYEINKYTITYINEESEYHKEELTYGSKHKKIEDPFKTGYTFTGWYNENEEKVEYPITVTKNITLHSKYEINKYTITFNDEDRITTKEVNYNNKVEPVINQGKTGYTFKYWSIEKGGEEYNFNTLVTENITLYAVYSINKYTVTFKNYDGSTLQEETLEYRALPKYKGEAPTREKTKEYTYTFKGWDKEITEVTNNQEYIATYTETKNKYNVKFTNYDGSILQEETLEYGALPVYKGEVPAREKTEEYTYTFKNWNKEITEVTDNEIYIATYIETKNKYTVIYMDGETEYTRKEVNYGETVSEEVINKDHNIYRGWTLEGNIYDFNTPVTKNITIKSSFELVESPIIESTPIEWTKENVKVTITTNHNDYSYMYKIDDGEYQNYNGEFTVDKNCTVIAKSIKENVESEVTTKEITNIDKVLPEIKEITEENITTNSFDIKVKGQDNESGLSEIRIYKDEELIVSYPYTEKLNEEKEETYSLTGLEENTTYKIKVELIDKVGNVNASEEKEITTLKRIIVSRIIGRNNSLYESEEEYELFESLEEAITACGSNQCTIEMVLDTKESVNVLEGQEIKLELNGKTVTGVRDYTIENSGELIILDKEDSEGGIINNTDTAIKNIENGILQIGENEEPLSVSMTIPNIVGTTYGIYTEEETSKLKFYDGKIEGNVAIQGNVDDTPYLYNAKITNEGHQVATLSILAEAEAKITGGKYYTKLSNAVSETKSGPGTYTDKEENLLQSVNASSYYTFNYDSESNSLISNNQNQRGTQAYSYIKIDLTDYTVNQELTVSTKISSKNGTGCVHINTSKDNVSCDVSSGRLLYVYGEQQNTNKVILQKGKIYYLHFSKERNYSWDNDSDTFAITDVTLNDYKVNLFGVDILDDIVTPGTYGFVNEFGKLKSNNRGARNTTANSYLKVDLTNYAEDQKIYIDAEISSNENNDFGYVTITDNETIPQYNSESGRIVYISGNVSSKVYEATLTAGKINYIHIGYKKTAYYSSGLDTFTINGIYTSIDKGDINRNIITKIPVLNEKVDTVELIKDITLTSPIEINETKEMILDLKGYTLTTSSNDYVIKNNGDLTIIDSKYSSDIEKNQADYEVEQAKYDEEYENEIKFKNDKDDEYEKSLEEYNQKLEKYYESNPDKDFEYTGEEEVYIIPKDGTYKLETWGAQGGNYNSECIGGYGSYSTGYVMLEKGDKLYINIGGSGSGDGSHTYKAGGYNGGGNGLNNDDYHTRQGSGGGATHIATKSGLLSTLSDSQDSILIVSGGGGAGSANSVIMCVSGGHAGGYEGNNGGTYKEGSWYATGSGGTQSQVDGVNGTFGQGGSSIPSGAGGGYYGGSADNYSSGGGSGYIGNAKLTNKAMYCYNCTKSSEESTRTISTTDVSEIPKENYAKKGNGYAKITLLNNDSNNSDTEVTKPTKPTKPINGYTTDDYVKDNIKLQLDGIDNKDESKWSDLSEQNNNGTISGATKQDTGYYFDGSNDYVSFKQMNYNNVTVEATITPQISDNSERDIIVNYEGGGYGLHIKNGYINAEFYINGSYRSIQSLDKYEVGKTYIVQATYDGKEMKLYVNNKLQNTVSIIGTIGVPSDNTVIMLGSNPRGTSANGNYFKGTIHSVRVYDRTLTLDELYKNYNSDEKRFIGIIRNEATLKEAKLTGTITSTTNSVIYNSIGANLTLKESNIVLNKSGEYNVITNEGTLSFLKNTVINAKQRNNRGIYNGYRGLIKKSSGTINYYDDGYGIYNFSTLDNSLEDTKINLNSSINPGPGYGIFNRSGLLIVNNIKITKGTSYQNYGSLIINNSIINSIIKSNGNVEINNVTYNYSSVDNYGNLTINNSRFQIGQLSSGNISINNSTFVLTPDSYSSSIVSVNNLIINNSNITGTGGVVREGVINDCSNVTIEGNSDIKNVGNGFVIKSTNVTIGKNDGNIEMYPKITSKANLGIRAQNLKIYDGTISSPKGHSVIGSINEIAENSEIKIENQDTIEKLSLINNLNPAAEINGKEYTTIDAAIENVKNGETVKLLRNVNKIGEFNLNGNDFTIDLNTYTLRTFNNDWLFKNSNSLKITDNQENVGTLYNTSGKLFENNGVLTLDNINLYSADSSSYGHWYNSDGFYRISDCIISNYNNLILNNVNSTLGSVKSSIYNYDTATATINNITLNNDRNNTTSITNEGIMTIDSSNINTSMLNSKKTNLNNSHLNNINNSSSGEFVSIKGTIDSITNSGVMSLTDINNKNGIENSASGILNVYSGNLNSYIYNRSEGTINLYDGTYNGNITNQGTGLLNISNGSFKNVENYNGTVNIKGGKFSYVGSNLNYRNGTITIGEKDGIVDKDLIIINNGVKSYETGILNFYDGTIKGNPSIDGSVNDIETGYDIIKEIDNNLEIKYLGKVYSAQIGSTGTKYYTIQEAVDAVSNDDEVIKILRELTTVSSTETIVIPNDKKIILDLNGYKINQSNETLIVNNGNLIIKDSSDSITDSNGYKSYNGSFISNKGKIIDNTGTLTIISGKFTSNIDIDKLLTNSGNMIIDGIYISSSSRSSSNLIESSGTLTVNDGVFYGGYGLNNIIYNTSLGTMRINGGTFAFDTDAINIIKNDGIAFINDCSVISTNNRKNTTFLYNSETGNMTIDKFHNISLSALGKIINNFGTLTINNSEIIGEIDNNGSIEFSNVTVKKSTDRYGDVLNGVYNKDKGNIVINNGEYNIPINNMSSGLISIKSGVFNDSISNTNTGTINLKAGTYTNGVTNTSSGTINIGTKGDTNDSGELNVSIENPNITGGTYGLSNSSNGKVNFYDGIISGTTDAVSGTINEIEDGYEIISGTTEDGKKSKYLSRLPVAEVESTGDTYYTLQEAIDAVTTKDETIKMLRNYTTLNTLDTITVAEDKSIILDLSGYKLEQNNEKFLVNNGTLKITDSSENSTNKIEMYADKLLENNGTLILDLLNIDIKTTITNVIDNKSSLKITNSKIQNVSNRGGRSVFASNSGNLTLENTTIDFNYSGSDTTVINNGTLNVVDGNYKIFGGTLFRNNSIVNIKGGTYTFTYWYESYYSAYLLYSTSNEDMTIDSMTVSSPNNGTKATSIYNAGTSNTVNVINSNDQALTNNASTGTMIISGGTLAGVNNAGTMTVSNSTIGGIGNGNGTLDIKESTLSSISNAGSGTTNVHSATVNGSIDSKYGGILNIYDINLTGGGTVYSGTINIYGGTITSSYNALVNSGYDGKLNIFGGTIISTSDSAQTILNSNAGTVTIGTKDGNVSTEMPVITGKTYGVNNGGSGKVNFYDGIVSGESGAFYGTVNEVEPGYKIVTNKTDTLTSATLTLVGDDEKVAVLNGINFTSLQDAINSASDTNESIITLYKDVTFESNITVPANKNIKLYLNGYTLNKGSYDFTGEGKITVIDGTSTNALANIMESVKEVLNIEGIKKNIIIYEMDDGSAISSESTYKLYKDNEEVILEEDTIGIYSVGNSNDEIRSANNKIYINKLPKGKYKLIGDNNKEVKFEIDESGKVIGNVKENTRETRKLVSTAVAELIIMIQTGIEKVNYIMIILTLLVTISSLLYIVKKTNVKES